jgi:hypothetical protein
MLNTHVRLTTAAVVSIALSEPSQARAGSLCMHAPAEKIYSALRLDPQQ